MRWAKDRASLTVFFYFVFHAVLCRVTPVPTGRFFDFGGQFYMVFTCGTTKNNDFPVTVFVKEFFEKKISKI